MGKEKEVRYLGDIVNSSGTMCDTIADRVARGTRCILNCFSEVCDITKGVQQINTLVLLYNSIFVPTILHNCEAWDNIDAKRNKKIVHNTAKVLKKDPASTHFDSNYISVLFSCIILSLWRKKIQ